MLLCMSEATQTPWCDCEWDIMKVPGCAICTTCGKVLRNPDFDDLTKQGRKCNARKRLKLVK